MLVKPREPPAADKPCWTEPPLAQVVYRGCKFSLQSTAQFCTLPYPDPVLESGWAKIEGYIAAKVIVEAVRRLKGKPTREGMIVALNSIDNYDLGGYVVRFKPGALAGSKFVELSIIARGGKIRQ